MCSRYHHSYDVAALDANVIWFELQLAGVALALHACPKSAKFHQMPLSASSDSYFECKLSKCYS